MPRPNPASLLLLAALSACTALEQSAESDAPSRPVPTAVNSDADRQAIYNSNGGTTGASATPDATPNRLRLGEQASDINRRKRPETLNTNDPNTSTPETRLQRLDTDAPAVIIPPATTNQNQAGAPR